MWKRHDKFVVESFDAIEQPTRYKLTEMHNAFRYATYLDKDEASLTRDAAIQEKLDRLSEELEAAEQHVASVLRSILQVEAL